MMEGSMDGWTEEISNMHEWNGNIHVMCPQVMCCRMYMCVMYYDGYMCVVSEQMYYEACC